MNGPILRMAGSLDLTSVTRWEEEIRGVAMRESMIILDMAEVEFIDSTGIGALIRLTADLAGEGRALFLNKLHPDLREVLEIMGVTGVLNLWDGTGMSTSGPVRGLGGA